MPGLTHCGNQRDTVGVGEMVVDQYEVRGRKVGEASQCLRATSNDDRFYMCIKFKGEQNDRSYVGIVLDRHNTRETLAHASLPPPTEAARFCMYG